MHDHVYGSDELMSLLIEAFRWPTNWFGFLCCFFFAHKSSFHVTIQFLFCSLFPPRLGSTHNIMRIYPSMYNYSQSPYHTTANKQYPDIDYYFVFTTPPLPLDRSRTHRAPKFNSSSIHKTDNIHNTSFHVTFKLDLSVRPHGNRMCI